MGVVTAVAICWLLAALFMGGVFFVGKRLKRFDVIDMAWGIVFIVIAAGSLLYYVVAGQSTIVWEKLVVTTVVTIWGARLATHIGHRLQRTKTEDPRYVELRKNWKGNLERNVFVRMYMVQATLATIIALPIIFINTADWIVVPAFVLAGLIVWMVGFVFETVGDLQLEAFVAHNPGKLMTKGLWKYSRHPNYFGEMTQWVGIGVMALSVDYGWVSLIGPFVITYLLLFVSGIPPAERRSSKRPGWDDYKRRTSAVVPLPPVR